MHERFSVVLFPGMIRTVTVQANIAISRLLASCVSGSAIWALYLANRLKELPMDVLLIEVMTTIFPRLSNFEARREKALLCADVRRGIFVLSVIICSQW
jgi:peptidoglycan biosynthesis protein MviN/MurJ (putative lipid II flippase)